MRGQHFKNREDMITYIIDRASVSTLRAWTTIT